VRKHFTAANAGIQRTKAMHDKVTLINLVWMMMMTAMVATSATFYIKDSSDSAFYGPPMTARYHSFGH
jgi:hypothetical protein